MVFNYWLSTTDLNIYADYLEDQGIDVTEIRQLQKVHYTETVYNNFYELKTLYSDGTIERTEIIIDLSNNIITPVKLDLNNMRQIDLLEYNFNFQLITPNVEIIGNKMNNINITENIVTYNIQTNL
jgi:hypothetical protein